MAWLYGLVVLMVTFQKLSDGNGAINNFLIFRWTFHGLLNGDNLYAFHTDLFYDRFKYSPTFPLLMAPFAVLPTWAGLLLWNGVNAAAPLVAVSRLRISDREKMFVLLFALVELSGALQSQQSNGLMAGLMIGAFAAMEARRPVLAALLICVGVYIKIFAVAVAVLFMFYDRKLRFIGAGIVFGLILLVAPALVTGVDGLIGHYRDWLNLLATDPVTAYQHSIMTLVERTTGLVVSDAIYLPVGLALLLAPLLRLNSHRAFGYRLTYLATILIWVVIFNHQAESPTYAIAMFGVALWGVTRPVTPWHVALLWFAFILTGLSASDLFPDTAQTFFAAHSLKALPCVVIWLVAERRLFTGTDWARLDGATATGATAASKQAEAGERSAPGAVDPFLEGQNVGRRRT